MTYAYTYTCTCTYIYTSDGQVQVRTVLRQRGAGSMVQLVLDLHALPFDTYEELEGRFRQDCSSHLSTSAQPDEVNHHGVNHHEVNHHEVNHHEVNHHEVRQPVFSSRYPTMCGLRLAASWLWRCASSLPRHRRRWTCWQGRGRNLLDKFTWGPFLFALSCFLFSFGFSIHTYNPGVKADLSSSPKSKVPSPRAVHFKTSCCFWTPGVNCAVWWFTDHTLKAEPRNAQTIACWVLWTLRLSCTP